LGLGNHQPGLGGSYHRRARLHHLPHGLGCGIASQSDASAGSSHEGPGPDRAAPTGGHCDPWRVKRYSGYKAAENEARGAARGVWTQCGGDFHSAS